MSPIPPQFGEFRALRYVARDHNGAITKVVSRAEDEAMEEIFKEDPELIAFVTEGGAEPALRAYLASSDAELLRVLEDLVNVLIDRNIVLLTDFPEAAQRKLMQRISVRRKLQDF